MTCTVLCCLKFKLTNSRYIKFAKRNAAAESSDAGGKRQLKPNVREFDFKRDCLLCGQVCVKKDPKKVGGCELTSAALSSG